MAGSLLGNAVRRVEDPELLRGLGTFVDNMRPDGVLFAAFVRSPFAHATLTGVDVTEAQQAPGVVAVLTAADLGLQPGFQFFTTNPRCARPPLAEGKVRFVGEAVAVVVAETQAQAVDAAELVDVDYDPLDVVVDMEAAVSPGAPLQFDDVPGNVARGERSPDRDVLRGAAHVVRARIVNQRLAVAPMEGNALLVTPGGPDQDHDVTVHMATQMPHAARASLARNFDFAEERVRVVAPHVGGAFGGKAGVPAEHLVVAAAALRLGRPVSWAETRSEAMLSMHGRGQVQFAELGLDDDGRITGLRCRMLGDCGAYGGFGGFLALGPTYTMAHRGVRRPAAGVRRVAALTNTSPDRRLPRSGTARGRGDARAGDGPRRRRARPRPGRDPAPQPDPR